MAARRLVVFAWYGNLVDAYKFYVSLAYFFAVWMYVAGPGSDLIESGIQFPNGVAGASLFAGAQYVFHCPFQFGQDLRCQVILTQIPKQDGYTQPVPRVVSYEGEDCQEEMRTHRGTRLRMARACDAGIDVIDVLLQDFSSVLARQGLKRPEIDRMRADAIRNINHQRETNGGRDIVDMVMNRAQMTKPTDFGREITKKTSNATKRVNGLKHTLVRLLAQEAAFHPDEPDWVRGPIKKLRQRVERDLVNDVTRLAAEAGIMSSQDRSRWCDLYLRRHRVQREHAGHKIDVLTELSLYL